VLLVQLCVELSDHVVMSMKERLPGAKLCVG